MDLLGLIASPAVSAVIGAVVAAVVARAKTAAQDSRAEDEAMREGMLALLRTQLTEAHTVHVLRGMPMGLYQRENIAKVHQAYSDLGGNDIGDQQYAELVSLPVSGD